MPQSPYAYCTQAEVERRLSAEGVKLRLDHDQDDAVSPGEQLGMDDAISDASETVLYYTWMKYDGGVLAASAWVNRRAVDLAAYVLCGVRGQPVPDNVYKRAEQAQALLKEIRDGNGLIPNTPLLRRLAPHHSNTRVDVRYQFKCVRVEPQTSTPHSGKYPQQTDYGAAYTFEI